MKSQKRGCIQKKSCKEKEIYLDPDPSTHCLHNKQTSIETKSNTKTYKQKVNTT